VLGIVTKTHPNVARSVALAACRATHPIAAARTYTANYDLVVQTISRIEPPSLTSSRHKGFDRTTRFARRSGICRSFRPPRSRTL